MAGIFDYKKYLDLLTTDQDVQHIFPGDSFNYTYSFDAQGAQGWTATIDWQTIVVDRVKFDDNKRPDFSSGRVTGYFTGSSISQASATVIKIPDNMYTGPILPASEVNIPITVVNISWVKNLETVEKQLLFIQNWEPGVRIGDPTLDENYIPILDVQTATLLLSLPSGPIVFGDPFRAQVETTNLPVDIQNLGDIQFFYKSTTTSQLVLMGTSTFTNSVATLDVQTDYGDLDPRNIPSGNLEIVARWRVKRNWRTVFSNTLTQTIYPGVVLDAAWTVSPNPIDATNVTTGSSWTVTLTTNSNYAPSAVAINNTATYYQIYNPRSTIGQISTSSNVTFNFINGTRSGTTGQIDQNWTDNVLSNSSTYNLITATIGTSTFTATVYITTPHTLKVNWRNQKLGQYLGGTTSTTLTVNATRNYTIPLQNFTMGVVERMTPGWVTTNNTYNTATQGWISIRASIPRDPNVTYSGTATVQFRALYTDRLETGDIFVPANDDQLAQHKFIATPETNQMRFDNLPEGLKSGDEVRFNQTVFTVTNVVTTTNTITVRPDWIRLINPASFYGLNIPFTIKPAASYVSPYWSPFQYLGTNWFEPGEWEVDPTNPGFVPGQTITTTPGYEAADRPEYHYRFNQLPVNIKIGDQIKFTKFEDINPPGVLPQYIITSEQRTVRAINRSANTVICYNQPFFLFEPDFRRQLPAYVQFISSGTVLQPTTGSYTLINLGTTSTYDVPPLLVTEDSSRVMWSLNNLTLNTGTYYIEALATYADQRDIVQYRVTTSSQYYKLVVFPPQVPDFSTSFTSDSNFLLPNTTSTLSITHFDYHYNFTATVVYANTATIGSTSTWTRTLGQQTNRITTSTSNFDTSTRAIFPGNLLTPRENSSQPKYTSATVYLATQLDTVTQASSSTQYQDYGSDQRYHRIVFDANVRSANYLGFLNNTTLAPSGRVDIYRLDTNALVQSQPLQQVNGQGVFRPDFVTSEITNDSTTWHSRQLRFDYSGDSKYKPSSTTASFLISPGVPIFFQQNNNSLAQAEWIFGRVYWTINTQQTSADMVIRINFENIFKPGILDQAQVQEFTMYVKPNTNFPGLTYSFNPSGVNGSFTLDLGWASGQGYPNYLNPIPIYSRIKLNNRLSSDIIATAGVASKITSVEKLTQTNGTIRFEHG